MSNAARQSTGNPFLDKALGGGLLPGTLTVVVGATGVGKSQLGIRWCSYGKEQEGRSGAIIDFSSRGDPQNHNDYAQRLAQWTLQTQAMKRLSAAEVFEPSTPLADLLMLMGYEGRRVLRSQLDVDQWHAWQSDLNRNTPVMAEFIYRHLIAGSRRFLADGIEPQDTPEDSLQMDMIELLYHRMIRQQHDWLARELFRQDYRSLEKQIMSHPYEHQHSTCMIMITTRESMLDQLMSKPWSAGDLAAGANTILLMGRIAQGNRMGRGLYIAKHRGSACDDSVLEFSIAEDGLHFQE